MGREDKEKRLAALVLHLWAFLDAVKGSKSADEKWFWEERAKECKRIYEQVEAQPVLERGFEVRRLFRHKIPSRILH